jgi:RNA polymerase sigma factor (sigma-70 family)
MLYSEAFKRLPDTDAVNDIIQEIFLQIWDRREQQHISHVTTYLLTMLRHQVFRRIEKEKRYEPLEYLLLELGETSGADALTLKADLLRTYEALLNKLTPAQQQILRLRFEEDLTTEEIALQLELSRKTVQNQLRTALLKIRSSLLLYLAYLLYKNQC